MVDGFVAATIPRIFRATPYTDSINTVIHLATLAIIPTITLITRSTSFLPLPLPARLPVPPPRDAAAGRPALQAVIRGGILYTRENKGNV
nr:hypothetical protein [Tanacetum cinerariifolium]